MPAPVGFVNDHAGVLADSSRARLESFLDQVKRKTGVQFAVLVMPTTAPLDPVEYKTEAFHRWFAGNRTSLLLLVAIQERRAYFETGYDLEGILPDGLEARILRRETFPRFRAGDYAGGIREAVLRTAAVVARDRGVTLEWDGSELRYREPREKGGPRAVLPLLAVVGVVVLAGVAIAFRRRAPTTGRRIGGSAQAPDPSMESQPEPRRSLMPFEYKMVQIPPTIEVKSKDYRGSEAAHYLQSLANEQASLGWEFQRVDTVGVVVSPGCLGALFGQRQVNSEYYVVTFRRQN